MENGSSRPRIALRRGVPGSRAFQKPEKGLCPRCPAHSKGPTLCGNCRGLASLARMDPPPTPLLPGKQPEWGCCPSLLSPYGCGRRESH